MKLKCILFAAFLFTGFPLTSCSDESQGITYGAVSDFHKACATADQCQSGRCIDMEGARGCSRYCTSAGECPDGFFCSLDERFPDGDRGLCRPNDRERTCQSCDNDGQCEDIGGACVNWGGDNWCLRDCALDTCPDGFTCETNLSGKICVPDSGDCTCNPFKSGIIRTCSLESDFGTCMGIKTCTGANGWTVCNAKVPGPEVCDGEDNNCDGNIDEGVLGTPQHCSMCGDRCEGGGALGTAAVCSDGRCTLDCDSAYFDANDNPQDGCECDDDQMGATDTASAYYMGGGTDCGLALRMTSALIPADMSKRGHEDYYYFHYIDEIWGCLVELQVSLQVMSVSAPHYFCVSGAGDTNEGNWTCKTVQPGTTGTHNIDGSSGNYYIKVGLEGEGPLLHCTPYILSVDDP